MKLLYFTPKVFYPDSVGGAQRSWIYIFQNLIERGWQVEVSCQALGFNKASRISRSDVFHGGIDYLDDDLSGIRCLRLKLPQRTKHHSRIWLDWIDHRLEVFQPDLVVSDAQATSAQFNHTIARGIPTVCMPRSVNIVGLPSTIPNDLYFVANSPYLANVIRSITNRFVDYVLPPVDPSECRVMHRTPEFITFVNTVRQKGVELAVDIARALPSQRFLFVKGRWSGISGKMMDEHLAPVRELSNVVIWDFQDDIREVYARTHILLVPSQFLETFGRVILEAQINGIPVIAARVAGIPFTLGDGGLLVDPPDKPVGYVNAIRRIQETPSLYAHLSKRAIANAARAEFQPQQQIDKLVHLLLTKVSARQDTGNPDYEKVFCVGLSKTGTTTMKACFEQLGLDPVASPSSRDRNIPSFGRDIRRGHYERVLQYAQQFTSFEDRPWNIGDMYRVLNEAFPKSKTILTVRDPESWWRSVEHWLTNVHPQRTKTYLQHLGVTEFSKDAFVASYLDYNERVIRYFRAVREQEGREKLLIMNLEQGDAWEKLCAFLHKPVPDVPFPHRNKQKFTG